MQTYKAYVKTFFLDTISDYFFLIVFGIYIFKAQMGATMYTISWPDGLDDALYFLTIAAAAARFAFHLGKNNCYNLRNTGIALLSVVIIDLSNGQLSLSVPILAIMIFGSVGLDYKKLFTVYLLSFISVISLAILGSACGVITNLVYTFTRSNGITYIRDSAGFVSPTDCAAMILFSILTAWLCLDRISDVWFIMIALTGAAFSFYACNGRNSTFLLLVLAASASLLHVYDKMKHQSDKCQKVISKLVYATITVPLIGAAATYIIYILYLKYPTNTLMTKLNSLLSQRLSIGAKVLQEYGVHLLYGTSFEMIGGGYSLSKNLNYNFIDSGYLQILIRSGFLMLIVIVAGEAFLYYRGAKDSNYRLIIAAMIVTIHNMIEHHGINLYSNSLLLLPYMLLGNSCHIRSEQFKINNSTLKKAFSTAAILAAIIVFADHIISALKTFSTLCRLGNSQRQICFILIVLLIVLSLALIISTTFLMRTHKQTAWLCMVMGILLSVFLIISFNRRLNQANETDTVYAAAVQDAECILMLKESAPSSKVYSYDCPYLYRKLYNYTNLTWLPSEDLSRLQNVSLIIDKEKDIPAFFCRGFCYCEISDIHSIYTNDQTVIDTLKKNGYKVTGYYSYIKHIDLLSLASSNKLKIGSNGSIVLAADSNNLLEGPGLENTEMGNYLVTYYLALKPDSIAKLQDGTLLCTLNIYAYDKQILLASVNIYKEDIDTSGNVKAEITFDDWYCSKGIEFTVENAGICDININSITYQRNGS